MTSHIDSSYAAERVPPATMLPTRPMYWSVRREVWENRSLYMAPLIVAALVLFGSFFATLATSEKLRAGSGKTQALVMPFVMAPAPIMLATFLVGIFYSIDALYGERRDRSILFWKSLPVSDRTTVLAKAMIPMVVLPLMAYLLSLAVQLVLLPVTLLVTLGSGGNPALLWAGRPEPMVMLYGLTAHVLWFAPAYCWLLLISAWARRAPFLWAVMPPLAIAAVEQIMFGTSSFIYMLKYRLTGAMKEAFESSGKSHDVAMDITPLRFLSASGLWVGLIFAAACLVAAVRLRRNREPI